MNQIKAMWSGKPSKKFILYRSFLYFSSNLGRRGNRVGGTIFLISLILIWIYAFIQVLVKPELKENNGIGGLIVFGVILILLYLSFAIYYTLLRKSYQYLITNYGVAFNGGIFKKITKEVPFTKITDINISQNIIERLLGIYNLNIQTSGSKPFADSKPEIAFFSIDDPQTPRNLILQFVQQTKIRR